MHLRRASRHAGEAQAVPHLQFVSQFSQLAIACIVSVVPPLARSHHAAKRSGESQFNGSDRNTSLSGQSLEVIVDSRHKRFQRHANQRSERESLERAWCDRQLIDRCLTGDQHAWTDLYRQFHDSLILSIQVLLGRDACRHDLVEDIAAKVWFMSVDNEGALLRQFDAERGCRLSTYLACIARFEIASHFRSERRRAVREAHACRQRSSVTDDSHLHGPMGIGIALREFLATLSPRESEFCSNYLLTSEPAEGDYSAANRWQLRHRVRVKLWAFLETSL